MIQPPTILIVDDDPTGRDTLAALLHGQEYKLAFAASGTETLALATQLSPDVILLDIMLPGMDGFEVCRHLRATPAMAEVPIIMVTALDDRDSRLQGIEAGADDFVPKPFDRVELRARISAITRLNRYRRLLLERTKFERVIELLPNGFTIIDADGHVCLANPTMLRMLGVEGSSLIDSPIARVIAPEGLDQWNEKMRAIFADPMQIARFETTLVGANGKHIPVEVDAGHLVWEEKPVIQLIARDIGERKQIEARTKRQIERLAALRTIDTSIASNLNLNVTLDVILDQVVDHLQVDAAAVLLRRLPTGPLEYAAARGFRPSDRGQAMLRGDGCAGYATLPRRTLHLPEPGSADDGPKTSPLAAEGFATYYGVPLVVKGRVEGVLEVFNRAPLEPDTEWLDFLETLAGQTALAVDHAALFDSLQHANRELSLAYDTTLEGWARALELRDKETEGHSQRVADLTVSLARLMGVSDTELMHIRRGALLHDIGKMGIPDSILLKPGALDEEEWEIMRKHPTYAYEMLAPIAYLRPALDIPYCHHERWDGTGYPRQLRGEEIPLAARIFTVVDVWDALHFDRPYRKGWPEAQVREYIRSLAGWHFDPQVVELFLASV